MLHERFIVLLGIFLSSHAPAAAQTPAPQIALAQEHVAPIITMPRTVSTPLLTASFLLCQNPGKSPAHFSHLFAGANEGDQSMERLPPMDEVKTLFFTQSSLPLVQLWSGQLQLGAFQNTLLIQNVQLGPLGYGGMLDFRRPRQSYPCGTRSVPLSGLSLSSHFGRTPDPGMAVSVADCWHRSKLNCIASVSMSSWMFDEEESQERIRRSDTCQRQERNGEAAHGKVRTRRGNKSSRCANRFR